MKLPDATPIFDPDTEGESLRSRSPLERIAWLFERVPPEEILVTTSLGASSALLLHMVHRVAPKHPVYFVDTGYLFAETIQYCTQVAKALGVNLRRVTPEKGDHAFTLESQLYATDPDQCCALNKVKPVNALKAGKRVWVSGLLRYQNANRSKLNFMQPQGALTKFFPVLDMTAEEVALYYLLYELPHHPLVQQGYGSVGCFHCTQKGEGRQGRWAGKAKTECGLHG